MLKVNNKDTRTTLVFTPCSSVSIVNFEQVNAHRLLQHANKPELGDNVLILVVKTLSVEY